MSGERGHVVSHDDIEARLRELMDRQPDLNVDTTTIRSATRIEDLGFDSISILDFMYEIESELDLELDVRDLVDMVTVGDLVGHLAGKLAG